MKKYFSLLLKILKKMLITLLLLSIVLGMAVYAFIQQAPFGEVPTGEHLKKISTSPNFKNGIFQNQQPTYVQSPNTSYWKLLHLYLFADASHREPHKPIPAVKKDLSSFIQNHTKITWFGHSTVLLQMEETNILIDPVFSLRTSPVQYVGSKRYEGTDLYSIKDLPAIDFVLISHDHYDHLDYESILQLKDNIKMFYVPLGVGAHLQKWDVPIEKITEMDWWDSTKPNEAIEIIAAPARHFSGRSLTDRFKTLWASYIIRSDSTSIYFGGDSGYGEHFKEIGKRYGEFDITMLESGQYHTYWDKIHMMPEETVQAHIDLKGKVLLPIHWGKFTLSLHDWSEPIERLSLKAKETQTLVATPIIGEPIILDSLVSTKAWWEEVK